jgi:hypothetical protein
MSQAPAVRVDFVGVVSAVQQIIERHVAVPFLAPVTPFQSRHAHPAERFEPLRAA